MCLPAHSPLTPNFPYLVGRGPVHQDTSVLPALGLKDSYLIPPSINKIRHSDKTPSPELFLQHYVIGLPGQEDFLNKAFSSPSVWVWPALPSYTHCLQPQLNNEETLTRVTASPPRRPPSLRRSAQGRWHMWRPEVVEGLPTVKPAYPPSRHFSSEGLQLLPHIPILPHGQETLHTFGCCCPLPNFLGFLIFIHE